VLFDPFDVVTFPAGSDRARDGSDPIAALFARVARIGPLEPLAGPRFRCGAAGFFGYDLGRHLERLPDTARIDSAAPDLWFGLFHKGVEIDVATGEAILFAAEVDAPGRAGREAAPRALDEMEARLAGAAPAVRADVARAGPLASNFTRAAYCAAVERVRAHIRAGDVYQINLAQRFHAPFDGDPMQLYARLRTINPAPFAAAVDTGACAVLSSSPELFLRLDRAAGDVIETRPIKGTRRRTGDAAADARNRAELERSEKDAAELAMIVDLERNDLGRVARFGSVEVADAGCIESYATVFHRVATVRARLREGRGAEDLLRASFPGGSVTGVPKIRAMGILEELEGLRRGVFTGSIGWIGCDGSMLLNIAIRTLVVESRRVHFHAGGGVVLDSDPEAEYEETLDKGRALAAALGASLA
jgi:para-aminobenzoate synthetase component 1